MDKSFRVEAGTVPLDGGGLRAVCRVRPMSSTRLSGLARSRKMDSAVRCLATTTKRSKRLRGGWSYAGRNRLTDELRSSPFRSWPLPLLGRALHLAG
jgi:hypothetical protein